MSLVINRMLTAKHLGGPGFRQIQGIILHDTAGSGKHNDTLYLANPGDGRTVSVDFTVERDGTVYQLNPDLKNKWCYHAGRNTYFKGQRNAAVNKAALGIEIVQKADMSLVPVWPEAQVMSVARLCVKLCSDFNLKKEDIATHAQVITDGSRSDPRKFPFNQFWKFFEMAALEYNSALKSSGSAEPEVTGGKIYHEVRNGDTLYGIAVKYHTTIEKVKALNNMETPSTLITVGQKLLVKE